MIDREYVGDRKTREPKWWEATHQTGWDRVKAAFRRDWEQTKADFSSGRNGAELNQDVGDTLAQATGKDPVPPGNVPNPPDAQDIERTARRAERRAERDSKQFANGTESGNREAGWARWDSWDAAERPLRYGFGAATFYPEQWDDAREARLRDEWEEMHPDQPWEDVRDTVREGWERARPVV